MSAATSSTRVHERIHDHEQSLEPQQRKEAGVHYTPLPLSRFLVEKGISALGRTPLQICDPTCGAGSFLIAAADALADRGVAVPEIIERRLFGGEISPAAAAVAQDSLRSWAEQRIGVAAGSRLRPNIEIGDMLLRRPEDWAGRPASGWELVVGNPPFLSQLATRTTRNEQVRKQVRQRFGDLGNYADSASLFLLGAAEMLCDGGVVVLIQPQSFLSTRDTASVRQALLAKNELSGMWASESLLFDASVRVCAPVLRRRQQNTGYKVDQSSKQNQSASVQVWWGGQRTTLHEIAPFVEPQPLADDSWGPLLARAHGVPSIASSAGPRLGEIATATAGFRDEFYALLECAVDLDESGLAALSSETTSPLITVGMIDPGRQSWGVKARRFGGRQQLAPAVDFRALAAAHPRIAHWVTARQIPKVLVATQTRVVEAVADQSGSLIPVTPTISVEPKLALTDGPSIWHLLAALLAPPVSARALSSHLGAGLSSGALRWSARSVLEVELPGDSAIWSRGAVCAQALNNCERSEIPKMLSELGKVMCDAYGLEQCDPVYEWWLELALRAARP